MKKFNLAFAFAFVGVVASLFVRVQAHKTKLCGCQSASLSVYCDNLLDEVATFDHEGTKIDSNTFTEDWPKGKTIDSIDISNVARIELTCRDLHYVGGILAVLSGCGGAIETNSHTTVQEEVSASSLAFYVDGSKSSSNPTSTDLVHTDPNGDNIWYQLNILDPPINQVPFITTAARWVWDQEIKNTIVLGINFDVCTTNSPTKNPTTSQPTKNPTTLQPTKNPTTSQPTKNPTTLQPTKNPTTSQPTKNPTTLQPTKNPTTSQPTGNPTTAQPTTSEITCDESDDVGSSVWPQAALGPEGEYHTCGGRISYMQWQGLNLQEAKNFVGCEVPTNETCGICKAPDYECPEVTSSPTDAPVIATPQPTRNPTNTQTTPQPTRNPTNTQTTPQPTRNPTNTQTTPQPTRNPTNTQTTPQPTRNPTNTLTTPQPTRNPTNTQTTPQPTGSPAEENLACTLVWNTPAFGPEGHTYTCGGRVEFMMNSGLSLQQARNYVGCEIPTNETCGVCKADDYSCPITPNPTPAPSPAGGDGDNGTTIIIVISSCGILILILGLACVVCMMRRRKQTQCNDTNVVINNYASTDCTPTAVPMAPVMNPAFNGPKYV